MFSETSLICLRTPHSDLSDSGHMKRTSSSACTIVIDPSSMSDLNTTMLQFSQRPTAGLSSAFADKDDMVYVDQAVPSCPKKSQKIPNYQYQYLIFFLLFPSCPKKSQITNTSTSYYSYTIPVFPSCPKKSQITNTSTSYVSYTIPVYTGIYTCKEASSRGLAHDECKGDCCNVRLECRVPW